MQVAKKDIYVIGLTLILNLLGAQTILTVNIRKHINLILLECRITKRKNSFGFMETLFCEFVLTVFLISKMNW